MFSLWLRTVFLDRFVYGTGLRDGVKLSLSLLLRVLSSGGSGVRLRPTLTADGITKIDTERLHPKINMLDSISE